MDDRLSAALAAIDAENAADPRVLRARGREGPKALVEGELASEWLDRVAPDASDALRIAVRGHHVRRWAIPRDQLPAGRAGYLRWRARLQQVHAATLAELLARAGYDGETIERVRAIVRKRDLANDPEVQALEDCVCLVFLETQLADLAARMADDDKMVDVLAKTLPKMSPRGRELAATIALPPSAAALVARAAGDRG